MLDSDTANHTPVPSKHHVHMCRVRCTHHSDTGREANGPRGACVLDSDTRNQTPAPSKHHVHMCIHVHMCDVPSTRIVPWIHTHIWTVYIWIVCACLHACVSTCAPHVLTYIHACVNAYAYMDCVCVCACPHAYVCPHAYIRAYMDLCVCVCAYACVCVCVCVSACIRVPTCIHVRMGICIYGLCACVCACMWSIQPI